MNESDFINTQNLNAVPMSDQTKFRLNEMNKTKNYFNSETQERKAISKKLSKYIAAFDYADKIFLFCLHLLVLLVLYLMQQLLEFLLA